MARQGAHLTSIEVVERLRAAIIEFQTDALNAVMQLQLEGRRPLAWIEGDRTLYWPQQLRRASDQVAEARKELERCEVTTSGDQTRYCYDERKALERAKRRLRLCEEKVHAVKRWRVQIRRESDEFHTQLAKLARYLEHDLTKGIAALSRMGSALDRYVRQSTPTASDVPRSAAGASNDMQASTSEESAT